MPILYSAVLLLAVGNYVWFVVARSLPPVVAELSSMLVPVVGALSAAMVLKETPDRHDVADLAMIAVAVLLALLPAPGSGKTRRAVPTAARSSNGR